MTPSFNGTLILADGRYCRVLLDEQRRILNTSAVTCAYAGTAAFDTWFRSRYGDPDYLVRDSGLMYSVKRRQAQRPAQQEAA